jgi:phenylacetate-CoA ligase
MLEKLYNSAPYFIKVLMLNAKSLLNHRNRYNKGYRNYLNSYKELWHAPPITFMNYQQETLKVLLIDCAQYVPWYKEHFATLNISLEKILKDPYDVLKRLPYLSKLERKSKVEELINANPKRGLKEIGYTSGTSGSPTKNYLDSESIERGFALWSRFHWAIGLTPQERSARFSGRLIVNPKATKPPFWIYNRVEDQLFMSSYHLTTKNCKDYVKKLNSFQPTFIDGYPSAIYVIAKFINSEKIKILFTPKAIAVTAETLYDYQRFEIEKAFGCKVYNQYASSEGSPFITECISGNLHVNEDSGVFEFLNHQDQPALPGEFARMIVSSFRNYKTPLLRYDIGDTVLLPEQAIICPCGCKMQIIEKIVGREDDILWTEEKGYVGRLDTAYKGLEGIVKSQIVQKTSSEIVVYNIVDNAFTDIMEKKFVKNLKDRLGQNIHLEIKRVEEIPLGPAGKFEAVKRLFKID